MKKLLFMISMAAFVMLASCNKKGKAVEGISANEDPAAAAVTAAVEEADTLQEQLLAQIEAQDIKGLAEVVVLTEERIAELADSGDIERARVYAMKLQHVIKDNQESIKMFASDNSEINQMVSLLTNLPTSPEEAIAKIKIAARENATKSGEKAREAVKTKAKEAVDQVKRATEADFAQ